MYEENKRMEVKLTHFLCHGQLIIHNYLIHSLDRAYYPIALDLLLSKHAYELCWLLYFHND